MSDEATPGLAHAAIDAGVAPDPGGGNGEPLAGSFAARMQERRRERERRTTELFEPPGFEDLFRVEMQVLGYKKLADIAQQHERQHDDALKALYSNADIVLAATVGFYMVGEDGELSEPEEPMTWVDLARAFDTTLEETTRPRVALIRLLDGLAIGQLANEWLAWNTHGNSNIDSGLRRDLSATG